MAIIKMKRNENALIARLIIVYIAIVIYSVQFANLTNIYMNSNARFNVQNERIPLQN